MIQSGVALRLPAALHNFAAETEALQMFSSCSSLPLPPPAQPPKKEAEKYRAAAIHTGGVAEFISEPGVILGVDGYVPADE
jgi:hypothetical protein